MRPPRVRWAVLLAPLVLPWVVVSWETGYYVVFALGWVDAGPQVTTILQLVQHGAIGLGLRNFTIAYPVASATYLFAVVLAWWQRGNSRARVVVAVLLFLAGLNVGFYALGIDGQGPITAVPLGTLWLWTAGGYEYYRYFSGP